MNIKIKLTPFISKAYRHPTRTEEGVAIVPEAAQDAATVTATTTTTALAPDPVRDHLVVTATAIVAPTTTTEEEAEEATATPASNTAGRRPYS